MIQGFTVIYGGYNMMKLLPFIVTLVLVCPGCGNPEEDGHIWKSQTDMIKKAGDIEKTLQEADQQQRQQIEDMTR